MTNSLVDPLDALRRAMFSAAATNAQVLAVALIGSRARAEHCQDSDVDLLVWVRSEPRRDHLHSNIQSALVEHGIPGNLDPVFIQNGPQRLITMLTIAKRTRYLDIRNGSVVLYGPDRRAELTMPARHEVLQSCRDNLACTPPFDARSVLMAALGQHYAQTNVWTTKRQLGVTSISPIVRRAWDVRCQSVDPGLDQNECGDFLRLVGRDLERELAKS